MEGGCELLDAATARRVGRIRGVATLGVRGDLHVLLRLRLQHHSEREDTMNPQRFATWFLRIILGLIIAIPTVGTIIVKAQWSRLQVHGVLTTAIEDDQRQTHVTAICDTGNGVMLYVARSEYREGISIVAVQGGCAKAQGER
jgi:hypothetical protein